ncbi:hypothetical protein BDR03DRAFT_1051546 [Suillus americanus]|nr:hypothetical protein BDR03DRAFT_1051546 [Suillus americanus]
MAAPAPKWSVRQPTPGLSYLPTPTESSLGDRTIHWSQLLTYIHRVITWGSHYSDINFQATDTTAILSVRCFLKCAEHQKFAAISFNSRRQRMKAVRLKSNRLQARDAIGGQDIIERTSEYPVAQGHHL